MISKWKIILGIVIYIIVGETLKDLLIFPYIEPYYFSQFEGGIAERLSELTEYVLLAVLLVPIAIFFIINPVNASNRNLQKLSEENRLKNIDLRKEIDERETAEEALRRNEQRYRTAQRMGNVGNWEFDLSKEKFWGSEQAKRIYGFDPESRYFSVDEVESCILERERVHQALNDLIENGKPYDLEFEICPINSSDKKIIKSVAEVEKTKSGTPAKVVGVIQDITAQRQADEELRSNEKKYKVIFKNSKDAIYIIAYSGQIIEVNQSFIDLFGYSLEESHDLKVQNLYLDPADRSIFIQKVEKHGFVKDFEVKMKNKSGDVMDCQITATTHVSKDNQIIGYQGIIRDVTRVKQEQQERERLIADLRDALAEVKTLSGLLPICSHCKKIRDDKGYWSRIETYIQDHSDAEFSHGICQECAQEFYPDLNLYEK